MNLSLDLERGARGMNGGKMLVWDLQANDADEELLRAKRAIIH